MVTLFKRGVWYSFHYALVAFSLLLIFTPLIVLAQSWSASQAQVDHYRLESLEKSLTEVESIKQGISHINGRLDVIDYRIAALGTDTLIHQVSPVGVGLLIIERVIRVISQRKQKSNDQV